MVNTFIFWDTVDFPLPNHLDWHWLYGKIKISLARGGFFGPWRFMAYGDEKSVCMPNYLDGSFFFSKQGDKFARLNTILLLAIHFACYDSFPVNVLLIVRPYPEEDVQLLKVIEELKKRGNSVLLVVPDDNEYSYPTEVLRSCTVWVWSMLLKGIAPLPFEYWVSSGSETDFGQESDSNSDTESNQGSE